MKLLDHIKDRWWFYITAFVPYLMILLFLTAYKVSDQLVIFISIIYALFIISL